MQNIEKHQKKSCPNTVQNSQLITDQLHVFFDKYSKLNSDRNLFSFFAYCQMLWLLSDIDTVSKKIGEEYNEAVKLIKNATSEEKKYAMQVAAVLNSAEPVQLIEGFCSFYESKIKKNQRSALGAFYTPLSYCISAYSEIAGIEKEKSAYDPFCGGGAWLCAFIMTRKNKLYKVDAPPIFGTDVDKNAVFLARLNVSFLLNRSETTFTALCNQIKVANTLYQSTEDASIIQKFLDSCTHVATNPPYGFSVESKNKCFSTTLTRVPDKEVFYYAIDKIRTLLKGDRNAHFLVPNTFLFNMGSKDFKKHLAAKYEVNIFDHTQENLFASATVRTALLSLAKKTKNNIDIKYSLGFNSKTKRINELDFIEGKFKETDQSSLLSRQVTVALNSVFEVSQGLIPYDKYRGHTKEQIQNRVYHAETKLGPDYKKELQGKSVSPFSVSWSGENWIKYGDWLAAPRAPKFFRENRILIREITDSKTGQMHCAYSDKEFYNTPSIINVIYRGEKKNSEVALKTLAVLISSATYADFHLKNSPKAMKGVFPKILVNDVRNLPLPANFDRLDLSSVYDKANKMKVAGQSTEQVLDYINKVVVQLLTKTRAA